ncbi:MAG TPA: PadR family transcriptional regulator [Candidatus Paceibacterota bacterium]|nr:PadR family transcriptional regulator [Verrucomicrobiota bacterium]HSA11639.1 PadR family transcriptional regulator [Candidatus Paceibacterota bacterium]
MKTTKKLSNAETALLGLLCEEPRHPWQIQKVVEHRDMRHWTDLAQATIYSQLRSLKRAGLVECRPQVDRGRLRKVYSVTRAGREALRAKVRELLTEPEPMKWRVDLGTYNLDLLPRREALACLRAYRSKLAQNIACYEKLADYMRGSGCPKSRLEVARRPNYLFRGEVRWVDALLAQLQRS